MEDLEELQPNKKIIEMERWNISDLKDYISNILSNKEIQEIFEFSDKDIQHKYMNVNDWRMEPHPKNQKLLQAKAGIGLQSQKQLFTILAFAIWYKVFKMTI